MLHSNISIPCHLKMTENGAGNLYHPVLSFSHLYPVLGTHLGKVFSIIDKAIPCVGESINHGYKYH